jgi:methylene-tetrahydromethanopterin dehydrogenase
MAAPLVYANQSLNAVGVGALAVGDVKYKLQQELLKSLLETEKPIFIDFRAAFEKARSLV